MTSKPSPYEYLEHVPGPTGSAARELCELSAKRVEELFGAPSSSPVKPPDLEHLIALLKLQIGVLEIAQKAVRLRLIQLKGSPP